MALDIIPLGGCGEIGKNLTLVRYQQDQTLIVDCGVSFPGEDLPGVDVVVPDPTYLLSIRDTVQGILLTHGHEDHVGGLPYLLPMLGDLPIYGTPLTLALIEDKLRERGIKTPLYAITPGEPFTIGDFTIEPIRVTHSIPDCVAYALHTPEGTIVFTGDFKFDHTPVDGVRTDFNQLARVGDRGVLLLLSDSTNAERPGWGESESKVSDAFYTLFAQAPGRILITSFASNIHRLQQAIEMAEVYGRKVAILGRRMEQNVSIAIQRGYLRVNDGTLISARELDNYPDERILVLTTGSQGEPLSALSKIAADEYPRLKIRKGDTVIISATPIPGNESMVWRTVNRLIRLGAKVYHDGLAPVHVSGHACQEELKLMISLLRPRYLAPVHGEARHQAAYFELARAMGYSEDQLFLLENGSVLRIENGVPRLMEPVQAGRLLIEEGMTSGVPESIIHDRRQLAREGILIALVTVRAQTGELVDAPQFIARGFEWQNEAQPELARQAVQEVLNQMLPAEVSDWDNLREELVVVLRRFCKKHLSRRPLVIPIVMEV
ncbi:MAG: ribonuclease J [Fimbriimonadales bacterium]|nr:ribonuclease J [Fimbriimonadales bacterium]GBC90181.1 Ribonuclease J1 [bacterium HR14]GIV12167.1 MAG: ribonuclease J [Fimbriimonadales bacterium]CUU04714.1 ribonuclease J [Armatimonadetes bacterium GBS]CUU38119.1 ribonuclease J [Armatimonadetes bacterium GXS]